MSEEGRLTGRRLVDGGAMVETKTMRLWVFFLLSTSFFGDRYSSSSQKATVHRIRLSRCMLIMLHILFRISFALGAA